jgi:hypothetical protein
MHQLVALFYATVSAQSGSLVFNMREALAFVEKVVAEDPTAVAAQQAADYLDAGRGHVEDGDDLFAVHALSMALASMDFSHTTGYAACRGTIMLAESALNAACAAETAGVRQ